MKVLMVISQFHPIIGGAEKQAQLLAQKLIEKGIQVQVVTGWWKLATPRKEIIDGIRIFRNFACWGMFGIKGIRFFGGITYMVSLGIYLFANRRNYDLIHVHQALYPAFVSVLVGKQVLRKSVIVKTGSSGITSDIKQLNQIPLGNFQSKYLIKNMDRLVATSQAGGNEFKKTGYPKSRIIYIPNGVEIPDNAKTAYGQVRNVITVARMSREKGIDVLLNAWGKVAKEERVPKLRIVGYGPLESELRKLTSFLGMSEAVNFIGEVPNVSEYLTDADLFVLPSRAEGMSNALLEAMSYGIPCIATNVGGNPEVFGMDRNMKISPGEYLIARNGLLVNPDDVKGLSEAILYLIREVGIREEMGKSSREFIQENYSIDLITDRYIALYQSMLDRRS
jgi:glycosyltransferase involved in cell wall biosynthesis